ncbi:Pls/PosA family non-ribosomal peptide synthetase [Allobranchiibius sp. CTAmp26]|uniref:Pls/PosA family non-ribosomal peptide synthetase n=1 Tax=Allobranchiibius sp. CTAmp26 TaxID=2815214 RepID=UPI0027DDB9AC|nr:Pls/PosA family non-ribosomal peptide synthetase [Allobranchiibius sp. CTAmp26]
MSALIRSAAAPDPRTLVEVFREVVVAFPDAAALDNGVEVMTYAEFDTAAGELAQLLNAGGVGRGDKVGVRVPSGTLDLYISIMGILLAGAAYVPVDVDDPDERARTVFDEAEVAAVVGAEGAVSHRRLGMPPVEPQDPAPGDDAWVIFTSGSTGRPKGVAVSHRSAAAFVDAESRLFLQPDPLNETDRVMAGLSVAFDASCEEMWLAWAHGGCLVPAPRSLVRSGVDVGPWLVANDITVISTVPTLVSLWPTDALDRVRLLIMGGEACPPEIGARLARPGRELWNTYGPTEATVVACGAQLTAEGPVRIGLPLDGWDLAVVDTAGRHVAPGEIGELIIGGVGLARYLDPEKGAEKYAPFPTLGWDRAYRSGDRVVYDEDGLMFAGRADDQIKLGGRRIELGEVDNALLLLPGVVGAAAAVRRSAAGNQLLVGYIATQPGFRAADATRLLRRRMPAALVPRLAVVEDLPTRTSGKIDRDALPWPLPAATAGPSTTTLSPTQHWIRDIWLEVIGASADSPADDFFDLGGGSLTAAQVTSRLRSRYPEVTVADLYEQETLGALAAYLDTLAVGEQQERRAVRPTPRKTQRGQVAFTVGLRVLPGLRWVTWVAGVSTLASSMFGLTFLPRTSWWWIAAGWLLFVAAPGRMALSAAAARLLLRDLEPGDYPRGGRVHLRVWLAERIADELGAANLAGAAWMPWYARALGARIARDVDLHSLPPITGMLRLGRGCSIEPEVDLSGHWLDGDVLHLGAIRVGAEARVGTRTTLAPGAVIAAHAEVAPGSAVLGRIGKREYWSGAPARPIGPTRGPWSPARPPRRPAWTVAYAVAANVIALLPFVAGAIGLIATWPLWHGADSFAALARVAPAVVVLGTLIGLLALALLIAALTRLLSVRVEPGGHPVHSRPAWQAWATIRLLDEARTWLFPLYAGSLTPGWLRLLGATVGSRVEASTVLLIPHLTRIGDESFLADDTLIGSYELGGGWLRVERTAIGKRAFVGNSGMAAPGRKVPKKALVAVLSAVPQRKEAKAGSSWLGSPPVLLRRPKSDTDDSRTYRPSRRLLVARGLVEACRLLAPVVSSALGAATAFALAAALGSAVPWVALLLAGPVLMVVGALAAAITSLVKRVLVGRIEAVDHPLWSSFVWRSELADMFVEAVAAPWFARAALGTPVLNTWLRSMGADIGHGVWCDTYWLPEPDLVHLHDGATVNRGCVVQTHLFHDRVLSIDEVVLETGSTLGPNSVILPASRLGRHATVGPVSLVMRGESVPDKTRWIGNPIGPWADESSPPAADDDHVDTRA